ncbi:MAG: hypothetical protein DWQ07_04265 [Chloroflexi bacterium]|nr:MAG: hypothetical protein DWQ07_04265 [Chloroflexota bacterium]MBL1194647.1 hypothetical protein [Chloroflexota bacterium]NOH11937.1 hypothetical protein [Chloroflexota bacterium]
MTTKIFMAYIGIASFANGVLLIVMPAGFLSLFGVQMDATGLMLARFWGAFALGAGVLAWQVRNLDSAASRPALLNLFVYFAVASVLNIWSTTSGIFNSSGWIIVVFDLLLAGIFAYLLIPKKVTL